MSIDRQLFLEKLQDSYTAYYNITPAESLPEESRPQLPLVFKADYLSRAEKYWLSKKIPVWANETNEFCYVFSAPSFDGRMISACVEYALAEGLPRVVPHREHQYTNIKTVFVASTFDSSAIDEVKSRKFSKSYNHSLWGYTDLLTGAVNVTTEKCVTNRAGHTLKAYFKKLFKALNAKARS